MSVWATQRKLTYISILVAFLLIVVALPSYYFLYKPPTCSDGKQDQGEQGIDCGGPCNILCPAQALDPLVHWARIFPVSSGQYNAVAYVENLNLGSYALNVPYEFDIYDANGVLIAKRTGTANIWANTKFAIFSAGISTGQSVATNVTFQFTAKPVWSKTTLTFPNISVTDPVLSELDTTPHLNATITNGDFTTVQDLSVVAIVYDANGNALGATETLVNYLPQNQPQNIYFVWTVPFAGTAATTEIIPLTSPISSPSAQ